jgi:release factor glutamine methyltransferase
MMKIQTALLWGAEQLQTSLSPRLDAELLLAYTLYVPRIYLMTHHEEILDESVWDTYRDLIDKRATGYPVSYITGIKEFYGRDFMVQEEILIPRPETEHLIEEVLKWSAQEEVATIVDIGAGSGAIGITLGLELPHAKVYATDISKAAVYMATENASRYELTNYLVLLGNLADPLKAMDLEGQVDVFVSNPPYISSADMEVLMPDVRDFEPHLALHGGEDGLDFYRDLVAAAKSYLRPGGLLAFEIGADQGESVAKLMVEAGYDQVAIIGDLAGLDRVVTGIAQEP